MRGRKYFPEEQPALEADLDGYLEWLGTQVRVSPGFRALLLGGGYGRGEGGIWLPVDGSAHRLYNDLEFYLFSGPVKGHHLRSWMEEGEKRLHIDIEIKVIPPAAFQRARPSMFYYDLLKAHVLVAGDAGWVRSLPEELSRAENIPPVEASRLLVNRGMSLLRCLRWSQGELELNEGFCDRIVAKLKLALGDAVLCSLGKYHWSCRERNHGLAEVVDFPPSWPQLVAWHAEGVSFKFNPRHLQQAPKDWEATLTEISGAWVETFLWIESRRLKTTFLTPLDYARFGGRLFPEESAAANILRQARDLARGRRAPWTGTDHPRSVVWKSLCLLLDPNRTEESVLTAAKLLESPDSEPAGIEERCRSAWQNYP
ncbi:MAG: hypothetical protein ACOYM3_07615 [Terrimicrobiaceae bacterium]